MYKPKPEQRNTNRLRLDIESKTPSLFALENQLLEAKTRRGCLVELPWTTTKTSQMFILGVQWDERGDLPIWTLYEQNGSDSKMHWSNPYAPGDLAMLYDIVCMSSDEAPTKIPDSLAPAPPQAPPAPPPKPVEAPQPAAPPPHPAAPPPPPYPMPPYGMPGQMPYPVDPAHYPVGYPYPPYYPPPMPGQPMPYPQGAPPPGWPPYPPPQPQQQPPPAPPPQAPAPNQASGPASPPPAPAQSGKGQGRGGDPIIIDYSLSAKRAKIQLGQLLKESRLIEECMLDAALKIQDLVEHGIIEPEEAPHALHQYYKKGQAVGEFFSAMDRDQLKQVMKEASEKSEADWQSKQPKRQASATGPGVNKAAIELLEKAGIINESDVQAAMDVRKKIGGDLISLLQSAKKLDRKTYDAAVVCLPLIREGLMRLEQCIIALNYCSRSLVDFDTALEEMGWQNPRKLRKDLPL